MNSPVCGEKLKEMKTMITADTIQWFFGTASETKPTNVNNGSMFVEIDTGKVNCYDRENDTWEYWFSFKEE